MGLAPSPAKKKTCELKEYIIQFHEKKFFCQILEETVSSAMILSTELIIRIVADADVRCCKRFSFFCYHHNYLFWDVLSFPPLIPNCDSHFILVKMESLSRIRKKSILYIFLGQTYTTLYPSTAGSNGERTEKIASILEVEEQFQSGFVVLHSGH